MQKIRLILRSDTTAEWLRIDPKPALNELVYDTDKRAFKRGDGLLPYSQLAFLVGREIELYGPYPSRLAAVAAIPQADRKAGLTVGITAGNGMVEEYWFPGPDFADTGLIPKTPDLSGVLSGKEDKANKGAANGYGSLDSNGKQPLLEVPDALLGNVRFKGTYLFATNIVTSDDAALNGGPLPAATPANTGNYFIAKGSGTLGTLSYGVGDWIISNGAAGYDKVDNTDAVMMVNGRIGAVVLTTDDIDEGSNVARRFFTMARVLATTLTGYVRAASGGAVSASMTLLAALGVIEKRISDSENALIGKVDISTFEKYAVYDFNNDIPVLPTGTNSAKAFSFQARKSYFLSAFEATNTLFFNNQLLITAGSITYGTTFALRYDRAGIAPVKLIHAQQQIVEIQPGEIIVLAFIGGNSVNTGSFTDGGFRVVSRSFVGDMFLGDWNPVTNTPILYPVSAQYKYQKHGYYRVSQDSPVGKTGLTGFLGGFDDLTYWVDNIIGLEAGMVLRDNPARTLLQVNGNFSIIISGSATFPTPTQLTFVKPVLGIGGWKKDEIAYMNGASWERRNGMRLVANAEWTRFDGVVGNPQGVQPGLVYFNNTGAARFKGTVVTPLTAFTITDTTNWEPIGVGAYSLPAATAAALGGIMPGQGLAVDAAGRATTNAIDYYTESTLASGSTVTNIGGRSYVCPGGTFNLYDPTGVTAGNAVLGRVFAFRATGTTPSVLAYANAASTARISGSTFLALQPGESVVLRVTSAAGYDLVIDGRVTPGDLFMGDWSPVTNVPALVAGVGIRGQYYRISANQTVLFTTSGITAPGAVASNVIQTLANGNGFVLGMTVTGGTIPAGTTLTSITVATATVPCTLTLSVPVLLLSQVQLQFQFPVLGLLGLLTGNELFFNGTAWVYRLAVLPNATKTTTGVVRAGFGLLTENTNGTMHTTSPDYYAETFLDDTNAAINRVASAIGPEGYVSLQGVFSANSLISLMGRIVGVRAVGCDPFISMGYNSITSTSELFEGKTSISIRDGEFMWFRRVAATWECVLDGRKPSQPGFRGDYDPVLNTPVISFFHPLYPYGGRRGDFYRVTKAGITLRTTITSPLTTTIIPNNGYPYIQTSFTVANAENLRAGLMIDGAEVYGVPIEVASVVGNTIMINGDYRSQSTLASGRVIVFKSALFIGDPKMLIDFVEGQYIHNSGLGWELITGASQVQGINRRFEGNANVQPTAVQGQIYQSNYFGAYRRLTPPHQPGEGYTLGPNGPNWEAVAAGTIRTFGLDPLVVNTNVDFGGPYMVSFTLGEGYGIIFNSSSNRVGGAERVIRLITGGAGDEPLTFQAPWKFQGFQPTTLARGKTALLRLFCFGPLESDVVAIYTVQP